jgi:hypothetical protein
VVVEADERNENVTLRSERRGVAKKGKNVTKRFGKKHKKDLTGPTLLEMSGKMTNQMG